MIPKTKPRIVFIFASPPGNQPALVIIGLSPIATAVAGLCQPRSCGQVHWFAIMEVKKDKKEKNEKEIYDADFLISSRLFAHFDKSARSQGRFVQ